MKAKDLMIGDYFQYGKGSITTVFQIVFDRRQGHLINGQIPESHCHPIPLTPEILEKAGFKWEIFYQGFYNKAMSNNSHSPYIILESSLDGIYKIVMFRTSMKIGVSLQYLHQLQNLYFSLTGEELNINL